MLTRSLAPLPGAHRHAGRCRSARAATATPSTPDVAIIGGGYAGLAAAVALIDRGIRVHVYEGSRQLGGRARAVQRGELTLDNGQHLLIGAYRDTLRLIDRVGVPAEAMLRLPLQWDVLPEFSLRTPRLPAPWHLAVGLLRAHGLSLAARVACARFVAHCRRARFRLAADTTVAALLDESRQHPDAIRYLWEPLCVAALNTPLEQASGRVFLNVLRDGLAAERAASDLIIPRVDLGRLFPLPAAEYVRRHGGTVEIGTSVLRIDADARGFGVHTAQGKRHHAAVVIATQPTRVAALAGHLAPLSAALGQIAQMTYQPIVSVYLRYGESPRMPLPMVGLSGGLAQWLFDRSAISGQRGLVAAVISTRGRQQELPHTELAKRVHGEIALAYPGLGGPQWSQVIEEKRATFACTPNLPRPDQQTPIPGLFLAGDYTASDYPATIEAAVRSGLRCAALASKALETAQGKVSS